MHSNPTIDAYDKYANIYDKEVIEFWDNFPRTFLEEFKKHLDGIRILNVGSRSGRDALLLRTMGLDVVCQDGSTKMIELTRHLGFESHLADFTELAFPKESFDGIWAYTSLIHIPKEEMAKVVQELRTLLKPGGIFAIGVIEGQGAIMKERSTMPGAQRYFKNYSEQELRELIEPLGFTFLYQDDYRPLTSRYLNQLYRVAK
ncbi:MAG TPA: class I SAM-dependent methyltransferase [Candidatus Saccharimonadales bacterium]|nr:class I SAM-dependent methyltransferase [Candidatus Saccharimonadales bacterium]